MSGVRGWKRGVTAARRLARIPGYHVESGLTPAEFDRVEETYGFTFADDHRAFLAEGLPVGVSQDDGAVSRPWPDWRNGDPEDLRNRLGQPAKGVLRSVELGWWAPWLWGDRPVDKTEAMEVVRRFLRSAPTLVPLCSNLFLSAGRGTAGHMVLSMWGADIICHSRDIAHFVERECGESSSGADVDLTTCVPVWRDLLS
ncbi:hypothetical protein [Stackebrandtia soli]|uniref:hypothetical protein n=1 Tax=Stackebrandtia soli TaxID=1892856 RepID=UPI0039E9B07D